MSSAPGLRYKLRPTNPRRLRYMADCATGAAEPDRMNGLNEVLREDGYKLLTVHDEGGWQLYLNARHFVLGLLRYAAGLKADRDRWRRRALKAGGR